MEKISVLMPAYNVAAYINDSVRSILTQSDEDFELLIVDDGSQDETPEILDRIAGTDSRIKVIHQENQGVAQARNRLIREASGEYIAFVDADDQIHPEYLYSLRKALQETGLKAAKCGYMDVNALQGFQQGKIKADAKNASVLTEVPAYDYLSGQKDAFTLWTFLFHRSLWDGISFPSVRIAEDTAVLYKLLYRAGTIAVLEQDGLYQHLVRNESLIGDGTFSEKYLDRLPVLKDKIQFWKEQGETELERLTNLAYGMELLRDYGELRRSAGNRNPSEIKNAENTCTDLRREYRRNIKVFLKASRSAKQNLLFVLSYIQPMSWTYFL